MVRQVLDDAGRHRLVSNVSGHLLRGVTRPVVDRPLQYWRHINKPDKQPSDRIANNVSGGRQRIRLCPRTRKPGVAGTVVS